MRHKHLFILTPPYSGSTLLVRLLATSPQVSTFGVAKGEGMHIPELQDTMQPERWDPARRLPWGQIRAVFERHWDLSRPVLVEKGPANMLRAEDIERSFEDSYFIVMMRDPYAWCESMWRRSAGKDASASPGGYAAKWLGHARIQHANLTRLARTLHFSYEQLCDDTATVVGRMRGFVPEIGALDASGEFEVHSTLGRSRNPITNTNDLALERLSAAHIEEVGAVLREESELCGYFGYQTSRAP